MTYSDILSNILIIYIFSRWASNMSRLPTKGGLTTAAVTRPHLTVNTYNALFCVFNLFNLFAKQKKI